MLEQRTELLSQISYFEKRKKELLEEINNIKNKNNDKKNDKNVPAKKNPIYRSNAELNNMRLQRILMSTV